jgi:hypothetical protein
LAITSLALGLSACGFAPHTASDVPGDDAQLDGAGPVTVDATPEQMDAPAQAAFCNAANDQLVACYRFENSLDDDSSYHHNGTATVTYGTGKAGMALIVGTVNGVDIADSATFDVAELTIEAWIAPSVLPSGGARAGVLDYDGQYGLFVQANGDLTCTAGTTVTAQAQVQPNQWTHVACTHANNMISIYANGTLITSAAASPIPTGSTSGITLGGNNPANGGSPLNGMLDQLRLYGVGRSAQQICMDAGKTSC